MNASASTPHDRNRRGGSSLHARRFSGAILAAGIALASTVVPGAAVTANAVGCSLSSMSGSWGTGWAVGTEADIQQIGTSCSLSDYYYLTNDITLTPPAPGGSNHTPIGTAGSPFLGFLDGYEYTISGLVINRPGVANQGFFGVIGRDGEVDNLTLDNVSIVAGDESGALAGVMYRAYMYYVSASGTLTGGNAVGGIVGTQTAGTLYGSTSSMSVTGVSKVGGFSGETFTYASNGVKFEESTFDGSVTASGDGAGGFVGNAGSYTKVVDSTFDGDVTSTADRTGGLVGNAVGDASGALELTGNVVRGSVTSSGSYVGGAAGKVETVSGYGAVNKVTADVSVTGNGSNVGGFAGYLDRGSLEWGLAVSGDVSAPAASRVGGAFGTLGAVAVVEAHSTATVSGDAHVGGLAGYMKSGFWIDRSSSSGDVTATTNGGGLIGTVDGTFWSDLTSTPFTGTVIKRSKSTGTVTVGSVGGGLVGQVIGGSNTIENSYSRSTVDGGGPLGGLIGKVDSTTTAGALALKTSYAMGAVTATSGTAGGLVGVIESGSAVTPTSPFWDTETTTQASSASGTGKTTSAMTMRSTFADASWSIAAGWSGGDTWGICKKNDGYPYLIWEGGSTATCMTAPTELSAAPDDGQVTISFTPGDDFGTAITNYEYQLDGGSWVALNPSDGLSPITITGLTNGTEYSIALRAKSTLGVSPASDPVTVTPNAPTAPDAPTALTATALDTGVKITFTAGADNGSAITNYEYQLNGGAWVALDPEDGTSPVLIFGLTNGTQYSVSLRAVNAIGESPASSPVSVTPIAAPVPDGSELPALTPGDRQVLVDGAPVDVTLTVENTTDLVLEGDGFELRLTGGCSAGACELMTDTEGNPYLQLITGGGVLVSGYGFKPNSIVHVWIFSTPTYVGSLNVDGDGNFSGTLDLPNIAVGEHTLQVNGYTPEDAERTANLGVRLRSDVLPETGSSTGTMLAIVFMLLTLGAAMCGVSATTRRRA